MRRFIVIGHEATTSAQFSLNDLSGSTGRLDVLLRCVNSAFLLSHGIRKEVDLFLLLLGPPEPPKVLRFAGQELRYLNPDERSTAALVRRALERGSPGASTPGVYLEEKNLQGLLAEARSQLVYLKEGGRDLREAPLPDSPAFLLSDHLELTAEEERIVQDHQPVAVSVGPRPLHSHHCITLVHNELDRRGL